MKKYLIPVILIIFLSCNEEQLVIPENVLQHEDMVSVMVDIQLVEVTIGNERKKGEVPKEKILHYYDSVYKSHNINKERFDESFEFYTDHLDLLESVYEEVINELSKRQAELEKTN